MNRSTQHAFEPEEIMAYLDGELEPRKAASLASHLEHCAECQEVASQLRQVSERLLEFEVEPCPEKLDFSALAVSPAALKEPVAASRKGRFAGFARKLVPKNPLGWAALFGTGVLALIAIILIFARFGALELNKHVAENRLEYSYLSKAEPQPSKWRTQQSGAADSNGLVNGPSHGGGSSGEPDAGIGGRLRAEGVLAGHASDKNLSKGTAEPVIHAPMIVETASITILASSFDEASAQIQPLTAARGGYVQQLTADTRTGEARSLSGTLRVPDKQLEGFVADLRKLGHVEQENQNNEEITDEYIDLTARLKTARATEQRIIELLGTRTGKLSDVLEVEEELERVRGDIESMDGQRTHMEHAVSYATVQIQLNEEYREQLNPESLSTSRRLRNSLVEGLANLAEGATGLATFAFAYGPSILFWLAVVGLPTWFVWRRANNSNDSAK